MTVQSLDSGMPEAGMPKRIPRHVAIVLDGNRRWARLNGLPTAADGHRAGFGRIPEVLAWCAELGLEIVTLWMLSDDNIKRRSDVELADLYLVIEEVVARLVAERRWRVNPVGRMDLLPAWLAARLRAAREATDGVTGPRVNLAVGYGGRSDLLAAVKSLVRDARTGDVVEVTEAELGRRLSTAGQPDPDLIIRPAGELRMSGFLLWQGALAEFWFTDRLWPDFSRADLFRALCDYGRRDRRLGG
jgi:short-chain Z-isoprenyl diphosphate synthase